MLGVWGSHRCRTALALVASITLVGTACQKRNDVSYGDGLPDQVVDVYYPDAPKPGMPVVVYVHGGAYTGGCEEFPGFWAIEPGEKPLGTGCDGQPVGAADWTPLKYVDEGAVVVSVRYRLAGTQIPGDGNGDGTVKPGETRAARHSDLVNDVDHVVRWVRAGGIESLDLDPAVDVDPDKLVVWGWSAGANLSAHQALGTSGPAGAPAEVPNRLILFAGHYTFNDADTRDWFNGEYVIPEAEGGNGVPGVRGVYTALFGCDPDLAVPSDDPDCQDEISIASTVQVSNVPEVSDYPETMIVHGRVGTSPESDGMAPYREAEKMVWMLASNGRPYELDDPTGMFHNMLAGDPPQPGYDEQLVHDLIFDWP